MHIISQGRSETLDDNRILLNIYMLFPFQEYMSKTREFERHAKAANLEREQTDLQLQVSRIKCDQFCIS